ncbi:MAG: endopeptidase La [Bacteroidales bacterium]|jgi:ATP-dependent Lon protease|nr:endopeptidase La [Bacteroidales bacterium]
MKIPKLEFNDLLGATINVLPIANIDETSKVHEDGLPGTLPILALRDTVLFPGTILPVTIGRDKSLKLIKSLYKSSKIIGAVTQRDAKSEDPGKTELFNIGTSGKIIKLIEMPDGAITAIIQGIKRFTLKEILSKEPYLIGVVDYLNDIIPSKNDKDMEALADSIKDAAMFILKESPHMTPDTSIAIKNIEGYEFLVNFISSGMDTEDPGEKMKLLNEGSIKQRGYLLYQMLDKQIEILKIKEDIQQKVKSEMDQQQREYYLNNQLKTIQQELGMDGNIQDISELRDRSKNKKWSDDVKKVFEKELSKLEKIAPTSPEYGIQLSYLEFILDLPWNTETKDNLNLKNAEKVLDHDHYGLEKVKERIIEYLAVLKLKGDMKSPIICLYGPPGVGKTSLGKSIAKSLGRKYERISLGGLHDESEIRGHRRTYIGAMPGRIIEAIKKAGSSNPVIVLDEIDKVSNDYRGDPSSALLEVLDPEQNVAFHDNYLDIDYDLSRVLFITTANNVSSIQPALRDRMEMINVTGYIAEEKFFIARDFLIPKQTKEHGLTEKQFKFSDGAIKSIINNYTSESGVRNLEKQIAKLARNVAKDIALDKKVPVEITESTVKKILGLPTAIHDIQKGNEGPGVVTGLAWTEVGGEILFIESSLSEGKGTLTTTGNLGDVMKESVMIAYQYIKAHPSLIGVTPKLIASKNVHVHVPEGAIPKDGPSAGIAMVSSMASAFKKKAVKHGIAMTGEMTLRGKVLPVGGIKEKILAAKRSGISTIVISKENERDIKEIKPLYIKGMNFVYVKTMEDVIKFIF